MPSVVTSVVEHAQATPDRAALSGPICSLTYRELADAVYAYAGMLTERGVQPGDSVLFVAPTVPEFAVGYLGIAATGGVVVPVNPMCTASEMEYFLNDAGCVLAIAWEGTDKAARAACATTGVDFIALTPHAPVDSGTPLTRPLERADDDVACLIYTSGTTGRPKGAELTVANLNAGARISGRLSQASPQDRLGTGLPLFHVFGQVSVLLSGLRSGTALTLVPQFTAANMIDAMVRDQLTIVCGVPTMWNALLHFDGDVPADAFDSLRLAVSGGAALPLEVIESFRRRFGCEIAEGYGLTESAALATFARPGAPAPVGTAGPAVYDCEILVADGEGKPVPTGERGAILLRGPVVMRGYHNRPEATAETIDADGWLHTGDIGELDAEGNLRIVDRAKELIIRGGYNVYPSEVENVLYQHPDVVEAAVVGIPDEHLGEEIGAVIALRSDAASDVADVREWVAERLAAYKLPRAIVFVDALPKGASGKVLKRAIDQDQLADALSEYRAARRA